MRPNKDLPYADEFSSSEDYITQLLAFATTHPLFQTLCGGVHILDFFTSEPGYYRSVIPLDWQEFLVKIEPMALLDLLLRDDLSALAPAPGRPHPPPASLLQYIGDVRRFSLSRTFDAGARPPPKLAALPRDLALGMSAKKAHEVVHAAGYLDALAGAVDGGITHCLDLGSGQNYLGRTLASAPYGRDVIAVESREANFLGARDLDVKSGVAERERLARNKKVFSAVVEALEQQPPPPSPTTTTTTTTTIPKKGSRLKRKKLKAPRHDPAVMRAKARELGFSEAEVATIDTRPPKLLQATYAEAPGRGTLHYVVGRLEDGDLKHVLAQLPPPRGKEEERRIMCISLHSCGNLSHHGLRALALNPQVRAVAIVGCCFNLLTERLGPRSYKHPLVRPTLTPLNGRARREEERRDPQGFPMSERLARYRIPGAGEHGEGGEVGVRFNITARMMACQAPGNWGPHDSEAFMTRHFYRSVLQRIFLDRGVIGRVFYGGEDEGGPTTSFTTEDNSLPTPTPAAAAPPPPNGTDSHNPLRFSTNPLILGSLPRRCFTSLPAYVRGAVAKLTAAAAPGEPAQHAACRARVAARMGADALTDGDMAAYEAAYGPRRRELEAVWSLMAFSAGVVESVIAVDRWLFLREQGPAVVRDCWVETLFEYGLSPRNLVVVGIKR